MKIRLKLTFFFTGIFIVLLIIIFTFIIGSLRNFMYNILNERMEMMIRTFTIQNNLDSISDYDQIKKLKLNFKSIGPGPDDFKNRPSIDKGMNFFLPFQLVKPPPMNLDKKFGNNFPQFENGNLNVESLLWFAIYDSDFYILKSTDLADKYPIKISSGSIKKKYFIYEFNNLVNNPIFPSDKNKKAHVLVKTKMEFTNNGKPYYLATLMSFSREIEYINELSSIIIRLLSASIIIVSIIGFYYSHLTLKPIKKIQKQLNEITDRDLSRRISIRNSNDEIGILTSSINSLLFRIDNAFLMEKQFVSDVSHEFKTPIANLRLSLEDLAKNENLSDSALEKIGQNLETLYRMNSLVKKLLYLSKLEQNIINFQPVETELKNILNQVLTNLEFVAENKKLLIIPDLDISCKIFGDEKLLYMAFYNIMENAMKYTEKGSITVSIYKTDRHAVISISDTGCGIQTDKIDKIFNKFYRIDEARSEQDGFGIGLAIVKRIIDIHNGKTKVRSRFGKGTTFNIFFSLSA